MCGMREKIGENREKEMSFSKGIVKGRKERERKIRQ